jgi:hypothetical protein
MEHIAKGCKGKGVKICIGHKLAGGLAGGLDGVVPMLPRATETDLRMAKHWVPTASPRAVAERRVMRANIRSSPARNCTKAPGPSPVRKSVTVAGKMFSADRPVGALRDKMTS